MGASATIAATRPAPPATGDAMTAEISPVAGSAYGATVTAPPSAAGTHPAAPYTAPVVMALDEHFRDPSDVMMSMCPAVKGLALPNTRVQGPFGAARMAGTCGLEASLAVTSCMSSRSRAIAVAATLAA